MLIAIDVGNTNVVLGLFEDASLTLRWRLTTRPDQTADELWVLVSRLFAERGIDRGRVDGVVLSSVVPTLTQTVSEMVRQGFGLAPLVIDADNAGLPIRCDHPEEVGTDRLVNAVAAIALYGRPPRPAIVVDFGTATTFDAISAAGEYLGGLICPGAAISADALFHRAARLPRVEVRKPDALIGRTTAAAMQAGLFYGDVAMVEGIVRRLQDALPGGPSVCIATGGLAGAIAAETPLIDSVNPDLTLTGLRLVWARRRTAAGRAAAGR